MTKRIPPRAVECPLCGRAMRPGERVRIIFSWEHWAKKAPRAFGRASSSVLVCGECGERLGGQVGVERPREVVA